MNGTVACPNGHPTQPGNRFCAVCGAPVPGSPLPPPAEPIPPPPPPVEPFTSLAPAGPPRRRSWVPVAVGILAVAAAVVVAVILLTGDGDSPPVTVAATSAPTTPGTEPQVTIPATLPPQTTPTTEGPVLDPDSWTVLVYMIGDNNLESAALEDLAEMAVVTPQDRFDIVVLVDRSAGEVSDAAIGLPDWTDTKLLHIEGDATTVLAEYGEADMGDPAVLTEFVTTGITDFPAAHYALILWDHGAAVFGIGPDDYGAGGAPSVLSPAEMGPAIRQALDATGVDRLDIVGFDACLMASLEVATGMAPVARYMIASEEYEPGVGWDWTALEYLAVEPHPTATGLGETIILQYHQHPAVASIPEHTLSMVDLDGVAAIEVALADLVDSMAASMDQYAPLLGRQRNKTVAFGKNPDPWLDFHMVDLGNLTRRLARRAPDLADQAAVLLSAIDNAVVFAANGEQAAEALGLTVLFPSFPDYWDAVVSFYDEMPPTPWRRALDAFFATGRAIPADRHPSFDAPGQQAQVEFVEPSGLHVSADFGGADSTDVADVRLRLGVATPEGTVFFSDVPGDLLNSTAFAVHGLEAVLLDDRGPDAPIDPTAAPVFHRITRTDTGTGSTTVVEIPLAYYPPGVEPGSDEYLPAVLVERSIFDSATDDWTVSRDLLVTSESGTVGAIRPDREGSLLPMYLVKTIDSLTWTPGPAEDSLAADLDRLSLTIWTWGFPGTELIVDLVVTDFGGNSASASAVVVVPDDWATAVG